MVRQRLDLFGKNLVHGTVELHGSAVMEVEIPPTDAMRLDLWFVPDVAKRRSAPVFTGALRAITSEPTVIEIWSDTVDKREFHDSFYKRHAWLRVLEMREKRALPIPWLWHICAGKPQSVADGFDFRQIDGLSGCYTTATRDWHVSIVVVGELPKTRDTVLLRLLGHPPVRRQALREIDAMPDDAWEKDLATGWVRRVQFDLHDPNRCRMGS
ncbi:MAG: hypothetical protein IPM54_43775 [Polyangiaceae bacterium]|nr:hypothetical protein [Polyangiaceae bacterium]